LLGGVAQAHPPEHNRAAFLAYRLREFLPRGENRMRMFFGIIIGFALAVGGAYVADTMAGPGARPMVNWDVVAKNFDTLTAIARDGWKKIAG